MRLTSRVVWWHPDLQFAVLERHGGFAVVSVYEGVLALDDELLGKLPMEGACQLTEAVSGRPVWLSVEAVGLTEEEVSELLGHLRD
ncbi:hypothetical protein P3W24_06445 [Luteibacter sp. PPL201]|jgi:hypothetical protein|uniref:Uncharacterized protein n=1 Tax=Luteibacter sahnii TaxID=3021977 RepID=A0ABT6B914_9GAMM|nr:hypothetical protein [Luteibacter sp. PPL193]MDY1549512.1 hypothetical protein [Luteibacter sp. PPL193]